MKLRKVALDTNLYVDWLNRGAHEALFTGPGLVRYLPAVVHMELSVGATTRKAQLALDKLARTYRAVGRLIVLDAQAFDVAGSALRHLRKQGVEVRRASLVNDVLIALSARAVGATLITADADYAAIASVLDFRFEMTVRQKH